MKQSLNFNWKFIPRFSNDYLNKMPIEAVNVDIPHTVKELPYNYFPGESYQFVSTYEKIFDVDNYDKNKRYFIRFNGYMVSATIYFNGVNLGNKPSAYIPVELEVSEYIKEKDNRLLVILDSKEDDDVPPFGFAIDYVTFGGIYREVYLISEPKTFIKNIYVHGDMNGLINISYEKDGNDEIDVSHKILDINKNVIASFDTNEYQLDKNKFKLWDIDNPNLYILETTIKLNNDA